MPTGSYIKMKWKSNVLKTETKSSILKTETKIRKQLYEKLINSPDASYNQ